MPHRTHSPPPLDAAAIERLALRYVERYATTRARLVAYLTRKLRERGGEGALPDLAALADRFAELGYIDDRAFGEARASSLGRRGYGARRIAMALHHAGVEGEDADSLAPAIAERRVDSAIAFARRRRIGPFAAQASDRAGRERAIAALVRAGHDFDLARRIAAMAPGDSVEPLQDDP